MMSDKPVLAFTEANRYYPPLTKKEKELMKEFEDMLEKVRPKLGDNPLLGPLITPNTQRMCEEINTHLLKARRAEND